MLSENEIKYLSSVQNLDRYDIAYADKRQIVLCGEAGIEIRISIERHPERGYELKYERVI